MTTKIALKIPDAKIMQLLIELDKIALKVNGFEYGLPNDYDSLENMKKAVTVWLESIL